MSWKRVLGHDLQVNAFAQIVRQNRLAHAYLFTGQSGIGKKLFAIELAKTLLCETPPSDRFEACDQCPSCVLVDAGNHPDLGLTGRPEESLEFPIELMRELCRSYSLKSARGKGRIAILDDADDLSDQSANCFLKTLEEPPPRSMLILIGTSSDRQMATIRSRCQIVSFAPLGPALVEKLLRSEGIEDPALLDRLVRLSEGSPGQAKDLADPALWQFRRTFLGGLVRKPLDSVGLAKTWFQFAEEAGKEAAIQRRQAARVLKLTIAFLRDVLSISLGGSPQTSQADEKAILQDMANRLNPDQLLELLDRCFEADAQVDRRVQLVLVLEALLDALGQKLRV